MSFLRSPAWTRVLLISAAVCASALLAESLVFLAYGAPGAVGEANTPTLFPAPQAAFFLLASAMALTGIVASRRPLALAGAVLGVLFSVWLAFSIGTWFLPLALLLLLFVVLGQPYRVPQARTSAR